MLSTVCFEYQRAFSLTTSFLLSVFVYFFLRLCLRLGDIKILSYSALDGSHKNRSPKAAMQITLIKFITGLHMILDHFMVQIRTFFQLHEYKYNIKFCQWTVFKSVGELSSILSVNCLVGELSRFRGTEWRTDAHSILAFCLQQKHAFVKFREYVP